MQYEDFELMEKLAEKYTAEELCELLNLTVFELLDAFEFKWLNNEELLDTIR